MTNKEVATQLGIVLVLLKKEGHWSDKTNEAIERAIQLLSHPVQNTRAVEFRDSAEVVKAYDKFCATNECCADCKYGFTDNCLAGYLYDQDWSDNGEPLQEA